MPHRHLVLVRHAKAQPGDRDIERPLASRGRADAVVIGRWLVAEALVPDLVVVSPSRRTMETFEVAFQHPLPAVPHVVDARVYENRTRSLLELIGEVEASVTTLAIVGHNPSLHDLAVRLGDGRVGTDFPTASVAVFHVRGDWSGLGPKTARLTDLTVCRA